MSSGEIEINTGYEMDKSSYRRCSIEKGVPKISQNSQDDTFIHITPMPESFLIKLQASLKLY